MRRGIQRVRGAVDRIGRKAGRKVVHVGLNIRQVGGWPDALFDIPTLDGGIDRRLAVEINLGLGGVARHRDTGHNDRRDDPQDRHDRQQFHQRKRWAAICGFQSSHGLLSSVQLVGLSICI